MGYRWVGQHRSPKLGGCEIDDGYDTIHPSASGEVARPLPVIAAPRSPKICPRLLARRRLARFGRQGLGAISSHVLPAIVPILASFGQKLSRIGANGFMVCRMRVGVQAAWWLVACARQCSARCWKASTQSLGLLIYSLRRSRGTIGRPQATPGRPPAAAEGTDGRTGARMGIPGMGKGLMRIQKELR